MEIKSEVLHNLIDLEIENIDFMLELINTNKNLSLSLINTFISTIEFHSSSDDLEFFNKMLLELQVSISDNMRIQSELIEIKSLFEKITSRLDKNTLINAIEAFKEKQSEVHQIELKLYSYTPKLLNKVNQNLLKIKQKDLREEIKKVLPQSAELNENVTTKENASSVEDISTEVNTELNENINTEETIKEDENTCVEIKAESDESVDSEEKTPLDENTSVEANEHSTIEESTAPVEVVNIEQDTEPVEVVNVSDSNAATGISQDERYSSDSLIISEITGEVILPFTHTVVDINEFKNPVSARFREGYRLSREREHEGALMSISIGLKLCFKSNIHPAIIRACRDFDDLDTYLFYLGNNQADYYPNFKILYKSYPMKDYMS